MSILIDKKEEVATDIWFTDTMMFVRLTDGREVGTPLEWFPKLRDASNEERNNWRFIGKGLGIHWDALDEDISVEGLL